MTRALLLTATFLAALLGFNATAMAANYPMGQFYKPVNQFNPPNDPSKIVVQEFFWFGCPHCFRLDPLIRAWSKKLPKDVVFEQVPNNLGNPYGVLDEKAFYAAKLLGIEDKIHTPFFDAIHVQHLPLTTKAAIRAFVVKTAGITPEQYNSAIASFEVDNNVRRADQLAMDYGILSVPTVVVGGEYLISVGLPGFAQGAGGEMSDYHTMLKVADYLIDKVRAERKGSGKAAAGNATNG